MPSFDVTSGVDLQEVDNALNQVRKELANRFDFKGARWEIDFQRKEGKLAITAEDATRLRNIWDVLREKMIKRGVSAKNLHAGTITPASVGSVRQDVELVQGIATEVAREIVKAVKDAKLKKVQPSIQGDLVRVTAPKRDELQDCIKLLKERDFGVELKYGNFRE